MHKECERTGTEKDGGLIFDEMHLQPGVHLDPSGDGLKMFGFVDLGAYNNGINMYRKGQGLNIGTTVLQFVFHAFVFPLLIFSLMEYPRVNL